MKTPRLLLLLLLLGCRAAAQLTEVDLNSAFAQLKGNGAGPFASALYGIDQESARQLTAQLNPLMEHGGDFFGYEIVSRKFLTKRVERVVVALYFQRLPVYLRIDLYDTPLGKVCQPASISRDAAAILPFDLISAAGK